MVETGAISNRGEQELDVALKKFSNIGANSRKMGAYENNMIFKTQPTCDPDQVRRSPLGINVKQLPFVMRDSLHQDPKKEKLS